MIRYSTLNWRANANGRLLGLRLGLILLLGVPAIPMQAENWQVITNANGLPTSPRVHVLAGSQNVIAADIEDLANETNNGLYVSTDGGTSWGRAPGQINEVFPRAQALLVDPAYILLGRRGGSATRTILRSESNGQSWAETGGDLLADGIITAFAQSDNIVFASDVIDNHGIYRSDDDGATWSLFAATTLPDDRAPVFSLLPSGNQLFGSVQNEGVYRTSFTQDNWQKVLDSSASVVALFAHGGAMLAAELDTSGGTIYRSTDDGASWTSQSLGPSLSGLATSGTALFLGGSAVGPFVPVLFQSDDNGVSWQRVPVATLGLEKIDQILVSGDFLYAATSNGPAAEFAAGALFRHPLTDGRIPLPPVLNQQPEGGAVTEGGAFTFTVSVTGDPPFEYQWRKDGTNIPGAVSASLALSGIQLSDAGDYRVLVSNGVDAVLSNPANLLVLEDTPGTIDPAFNANPTGSFSSTLFVQGSIQALAAAADGRIFAGGIFNTLAGEARRGIGRLNSNGTLNAALGLNGGVNGSQSVRAIGLEKNGSIIIGGTFTSVDGITAFRLARLGADGSVNSAFSGVSVNQPVNDIEILPDGRILLGGDFSTVNDIARRRIAILHVDGSVDSTFLPPDALNDEVRALAVQPDGKVIVGGDFNFVANARQSRGILRLNGDGSIDSTFDAGEGAGGSVRTVAIQENGAVIIAGDFTTFNGSSYNRIVRLLPTGAIDTSFQPSAGADAVIHQALVQGNGRIVIGGAFTTFGEASVSGRSYLTRLMADGAPDATFIPGLGINAPVTALALQSNGDILAGTYFPPEVRDPPPTLLFRLIGDPAPARIVDAPVARTVDVGETVTLSVTATGFPPLAYQWFQDSVAIPDAIGSTLDLGVVGLEDDAVYSVRVANSLNSVTSVSERLTVLAPLSIITDPAHAATTIGGSATFDVAVGGLGPFTYQWEKNESPLTGQTGPTLTLTSVTLADAGSYRVVITNATTTKISNAAVLAVNYILSATHIGFGDVNTTRGSHAPGAHVAAEAIAATGHQFVAWFGDVPESDRTDNPLTVVMDQDRSIAARFGIVVPVTWYDQYPGLTETGGEDDPDADGFSNREEFEIGMRPDNGALDGGGSLTLEIGWNLVSLPVQPVAGTQIAALFATAAPLSALWWDAWSRQVRAGQPVRAKRGYWLYSGSAIAEQSVNGHAIMDPAIRLFAGWNLVGPAVEQSLAGVSGVTGTVWLWNATAGRFEAIPDGILRPGIGYWVYATVDGATIPDVVP